MPVSRGASAALYVDLSSAPCSAILDHDQQRAVPISVRQGARILYRHNQLVALHARYRAQLAAGEHWTVVQALEAVSAAREAS
jgi:hypothetical protein